MIVMSLISISMREGYSGLRSAAKRRQALYIGCRMKIYTKTGDAGDTGLFGGGRVAKSHPRVEAYGDVDELNAVLGVVRATEPMPRVDDALRTIQRDLFAIGALLATSDLEKMQR